MSVHLDQSILELQGHITGLEGQVADTKKAINALCRVAGKPPIYTDIDADSRILTGAKRGDEYYGRALASVAREILEERQRVGLGPATVDELYDAMKEGGYQFDAANPHNAKKGLRISLAKNSTTFHKLPNNGKFGLLQWYPAVKEAKPKAFAAAVDELVEADTAALDEIADSLLADVQAEPVTGKPR